MNRGTVGLVCAGLLCLAAARTVRAAANVARASWPKVADPPFAPSPAAAPFTVMGYRELGADLLWVRMVGYFGGKDDTAEGIAALVEAGITLDPTLERFYEWGSRAMLLADHGVGQPVVRHALDILQRGMKQFPRSWKIHRLAGDVYIQDLQAGSDDEKRRNMAKGAELLERSVRMPDSPPALASTVAAELWSRLGQHERAVASLREMIMLTEDQSAQRRLIDKLAELEKSSAAELTVAFRDEHRRFMTDWQADRPSLPPTMYVLVGPRRGQFLRPHDLAVDRDLIGADLAEPLEPLADE